MVLSLALHEYASRAAGALGHGVEVSVTVREHGVALRAASSAASATRCDQAEVRADDGPCIDAMDRQKIEVVPRIADSTRWPEWCRQARTEGFVRALAVPAEVGPGFELALNVYSWAHGDWPASEVETADACAELIAAGVRLHLEFTDVEDAAAGLYRAMADSVAVEKAVGAVMEANDCSAEEARALLRWAAQHRGVDERSVAESILRSLAMGGWGDIVDGQGR